MSILAFFYPLINSLVAEIALPASTTLPLSAVVDKVPSFFT